MTKRSRDRRPAELDPAEAIDVELERSRRHGKQCSLVRLVGRGRGPAVTPDATRRTDVVWQVADDVLLLLPETGPQAAARCAQRLGPATATATATFPDDALTAHGLVGIVLGLRPGGAAPAPSAPELSPGLVR